MTLPTHTDTLRIHTFRALQPGPRLIVLGAVHGNEIAGTRAIERVLSEFDSGALSIVRGTVTFVPVTNPLAYRNAQRIGERNREDAGLRETSLRVRSREHRAGERDVEAGHAAKGTQHLHVGAGAAAAVENLRPVAAGDGLFDERSDEPGEAAKPEMRLLDAVGGLEKSTHSAGVILSRQSRADVAGPAGPQS